MARGGSASRVNNGRELKMYLRHGMWREHKYALLAVGVIVVAFFGGAVLQFSMSKEHVYRIEVTNQPLLERVFRSGEPWVVLCAKPDDVMPDVFSKVSKRLVDKSYVGVLDCTQKLPESGKSVLSRYGIKTSVSPTVFTVANGDKPKQTSKALAKRVVAQTKKTSQEILNSAQLELKCLQKSMCVLFLRGQKLRPYERQWMDKLMLEHRTLQFAWIDSTILKLSIESMLPDFVRGEHRMVLFRRQRDPSGEKHKAVITAKAYRNVFDAMPVTMFLKENVGTELKALSKTPTISRRKSNKAKKLSSSKSEASSSKKANGGRRSNTKRQAKAPQDSEEKGDEYYFPQGVDEEDAVDVDAAPDSADDDTEVLDLDAE
ncbi:hypothetical protein FI667_g9837, partial [Globisporangium splendens]